MLQLLLRRGGAAEKSMTFLPKWKAERMSPAGPAAALGAASNALSTDSKAEREQQDLQSDPDRGKPAAWGCAHGHGAWVHKQKWP